jgi:hypothetical protein
LWQVSDLRLEDTPTDAQRLVVWLEGVLATTHDIAPTMQNIEEPLETGSSAYKLDRATLATLYEQKTSTIQPSKSNEDFGQSSFAQR